MFVSDEVPLMIYEHMMGVIGFFYGKVNRTVILRHST